MIETVLYLLPIAAVCVLLGAWIADIVGMFNR